MRLVLLAAFALVAAPAAAADRCERSRTLPATGAFYPSTAPFEHFGADRTQVFPATCTLRELTGSATPEIRVRASAEDFATPYNAVTRARGELFLYGYGADAAAEGAYVSSIAPGSLRERWRTRIPDPVPAGQWSYPGVALAHRNGFLYAIYGNVLVKLDPADGRVVRRATLPEDADGTGAAYNGMILLPDGRIAAKKIERGPCPQPAAGTPAGGGAIVGLLCSVANALPSVVVVVDPRRLAVLDEVTTPEPVTGRITFGRGRLYAAGRDTLFRYRYRRGRLTLDRGWGPVRYRAEGQQPGTGPGLMGRFVVVQTNFLPASVPMTVTAVDTEDDTRIFQAVPFPDTESSVIVSKAALDAANRTVVTHDTTAGRMAALRLHPRRGFTVRWQRPLRSLAFSALVGDAAHRQIVIPDSAGGPDEVVWLDLASGRELARSAPLADSPAPGNIVTPGFGGRYDYASTAGRLWELRPEAGP
jgi:hypothetical protein